MDKPNPVAAQNPGGLFDAGSNLLGGLDVVDLDVNHTDTDPEPSIDLPKRSQVFFRTMSQLEDKMVRLQSIQEADQAPPGAVLDNLPSIIPKAEVHSLLHSLADTLKDLVDRRGGKRSILGVAGDVRFIDLQAGAGEA